MARWRRLINATISSTASASSVVISAVPCWPPINPTRTVSPQNGFELLANVIGAAAHQAHLISTNPGVICLQQDQIHGASRSVRMESA